MARRLQSRQHVAFDASRPSFERRKYSHELVGRYAEPTIGYRALPGRASGRHPRNARRITAAPAGRPWRPFWWRLAGLRLAGATTLCKRSGSGLPARVRLQGWTAAS